MTLSYTSHLVQEEFLPTAELLRQAFERHMGQPEAHDSRHHAWDYWFVPGLYTYLTTQPARVLGEPLVDSFVTALRSWCMDHLGMDNVSEPKLSLYVNGCGQELHNDAGNGCFAYVYSLTRWGQRTFSGGETVLFLNEYWGTERIALPQAGAALCKHVPPLFNQLLVFDDRVIHGVRPIQGQMDPLLGRLVLHGHISPGGVRATGALSGDVVERVLARHRYGLEEALSGVDGAYHGVITLRLAVDRVGRVTAVTVLANALRRVDTPSQRSCAEAAKTVVEWADAIRFPDAPCDSVVVIPVPLAFDALTND